MRLTIEGMEPDDEETSRGQGCVIALSHLLWV